MIKNTIITIATLGLLSVTASAFDDKGCAGCHGADMSKAAMGKSKVVSEMSATEIVDALNGYKAGTYGGPMKMLMKGQAAGMSEADITAFAEKHGTKTEEVTSDDNKTEEVASDDNKTEEVASDDNKTEETK